MYVITTQHKHVHCVMHIHTCTHTFMHMHTHTHTHAPRQPFTDTQYRHIFSQWNRILTGYQSHWLQTPCQGQRCTDGSSCLVWQRNRFQEIRERDGRKPERERKGKSEGEGGRERGKGNGKEGWRVEGEGGKNRGSEQGREMYMYIYMYRYMYRYIQSLRQGKGGQLHTCTLEW